MSNIVPILTGNDDISHGKVLEALPFCIENCSKGVCKKHYERMKTSDEGFYMCPRGLTTYIRLKASKRYIYTSLRVKGFYKKGSDMSNKRGLLGTTSSFSPIIGQDMLVRLIECNDKPTESVLEDRGIHNELLHDIRKLNAHIKNKAEEIISLDDNIQDRIEDIDIFDTLQKIRNIEAMAGIVASRFEVYDLTMNPAIMCYGRRRQRVVYKKFHKAKYMLIGYMDKNVTIDLFGNSIFEFPVYQTFDSLPFILLENAVKYAPENSHILVNFREEYNNLYITITSNGPYCSDTKKLCEKGYRTEEAKKISSVGNGLGLYIASEICSAHGINMSITSKQESKIKGIAFGPFEISLSFFHD